VLLRHASFSTWQLCWLISAELHFEGRAHESSD
jgi:hypothetical protein